MGFIKIQKWSTDNIDLESMSTWTEIAGKVDYAKKDFLKKEKAKIDVKKRDMTVRTGMVVGLNNSWGRIICDETEQFIDFHITKLEMHTTKNIVGRYVTFTDVEDQITRKVAYKVEEIK